MSAGRIVTTLGLLGFGLTASLGAQGLGDTAARERAKRAQPTQAKKPEAKVFTNDDLDRGKPPGPKPEGGSTGDRAAPSEGEGQPPEPAEDRLEQERPFLDGIRAAEEEVTAAEDRIRELSGKLNPMSTSYIYGASGSNDANEELRVRAELRQAESQLQAARQGVVTANQNLQDFRRGRSVGSSVSDR